MLENSHIFGFHQEKLNYVQANRQTDEYFFRQVFFKPLCKMLGFEVRMPWALPFYIIGSFLCTAYFCRVYLCIVYVTSLWKQHT